MHRVPTRTAPPRGAAALALPLRQRLHGQRRRRSRRRPQRRYHHHLLARVERPSEIAAIQATVKAFEAEYPNIHVKVVGNITDDKINQALRAGGRHAPDVVSSFTTDNVGEFCSSHVFADLTPFLEKSGIDPKTTFPQALLDYTQYKGDQCALPLLSDSYGLYYNKDAFKAAGISGPPKTLSEFKADAIKLTKSDRRLVLAARLHARTTTATRRWSTHYAALWGPTYFDRRREVGRGHRSRASRRCSRGRRAWSTRWAASPSSRSTAPRSVTSSAPRTRS